MLIESKITLKVKLFLKCDEIKSYVSSRRLVNLREDSIKRVKINGLIIENSYSRRIILLSYELKKNKNSISFLAQPFATSPRLLPNRSFISLISPIQLLCPLSIVLHLSDQINSS